MTLDEVLGKLKQHPTAVAINSGGRNEHHIQLLYYKGELSWTAGMTTGGKVDDKLLARLKSIDQGNWALYPDLYSQTPIVS